MPPVTLLASAALALLTGAGFAIVGVMMMRRAPPTQGQAARVMFALFWTSAAIIWITQGLGSLSGYLGVASLPLLSALDQVSTPFYCLAAASLLYYVLYLLTGRARLLVPILTYYLVLFFLLRWRVESAQRLDINVQDWVVSFVYATPLQGAAYSVIVSLVSGPLLLSILAYGALFFRVDEPAQRYRIALVALGLLAWIGTESIAFTTGFATTAAGEITRRVVALASTLVIVLAYRPPRAVEARLAAASV